ncbi:UDP-N-acetylmuramate dehydrogenase [Candidatus Gottesmanbacteria bacterium]|nr:UDP-N-acetylmuramate dehydrogenase [Candidatus Gottesmanbacteria bacterium]
MNNNFHFQQNVSLAPFSTFHIGGTARQFISVQNPDELLEIIQWANENKIEYKVFAGGSNVVFPDKGLDCLVIQILGGYIKRQENKFIVDAGMLLMDVVSESIDYGLAGLENLSGIPGTIGGAVVGNAGAYGHSISEVVEKVEIWDGKEKRLLTNSECNFSYRESIFKEKPFLVLKVTCKLEKVDSNRLKTISADIIRMREKKYRPGIKCPGSFFKNILTSEIDKDALGRIDTNKIVFGKMPAGFLLEEVGAKGMQVGGIKIADFHGNLFINTGGGTAADVKKLAGILKQKVKEKFGIVLEEEIRYF